VAFPELTRIKLGIPTVADFFKANGYVTGLIGKWHCGVDKGYTPVDRGFDEFAGFFEGSPNLDVPDYNSYWLTEQSKTCRVEGDYLTENLNRRAVDFVRRHKNHPFFLHLAHYAPHRPLGAPADLVTKYIQKGIDSTTSVVYAMIEVMDRGIGDLLDELDRQGISENTIILFASDNGPDPKTGERYNLQLRGSKYTVYEGGIRVPLVFRWKGHLSAGTSEQRVQFVDVLPTLIDLCNLKTDRVSLSLDGRSFIGNLRNTTAVGKEIPLFWQWNRGAPLYSHNAAVRLGDWKLVRPYVTRNVPKGESALPVLLYNTKLDPSETKDFSTSFPEIYSDLLKRLDQWSRRVEAQRLQK
jgi:arylsulfatase A